MYLQKSTCTVINKLPLTTDFLMIMISAGEEARQNTISSKFGV